MKKVYREANSNIAYINPTNPKNIIQFKLAYQKQKMRKLMNIRTEEGGIADKLTFQRGITTWKYPNRRKEKPKYEWTQQTLQQMWRTIQQTDPTHRHTHHTTKKTTQSHKQSETLHNDGKKQTTSGKTGNPCSAGGLTKFSPPPGPAVKDGSGYGF